MTKKAIHPLQSEADYEAAIDEIERYFDNEPEIASAEADHFDLLASIIEDYEQKHWPLRQEKR